MRPRGFMRQRFENTGEDYANDDVAAALPMIPKGLPGRSPNVARRVTSAFPIIRDGPSVRSDQDRRISASGLTIQWKVRRAARDFPPMYNVRWL